MEDSKFSSRKFILAVVASLSPIALLVTGHIHPAEYVEITKWVIGLYIAGNVAEKSTLVVPAK